MLIDYAVEITLHQVAKDKQRDLKSLSQRDKAYEHSAALEAALALQLPICYKVRALSCGLVSSAPE
jgi:hypothetical protein